MPCGAGLPDAIALLAFAAPAAAAHAADVVWQIASAGSINAWGGLAEAEWRARRSRREVRHGAKNRSAPLLPAWHPRRGTRSAWSLQPGCDRGSVQPPRG